MKNLIIVFLLILTSCASSNTEELKARQSFTNKSSNPYSYKELPKTVENNAININKLLAHFGDYKEIKRVQDSLKALHVVDVVDTVKPVISLIGNSNIELFLGDNYAEQGATAFDDVDGDITNKIDISGSVNTNSEGVYIVKYNVSDNSGNKAIQLLRSVSIIIPEPPQPLKAFPTASGSGSQTTGGRGKPVYIVTNLNNSGSGSLRQILEDTKSTNGGQIVFNVSGVVNLSSNLFSAGIKNVTISGQTAPAGGITIGNYPMGFYSSNSQTVKSENIIIRYIAVRPDSFSALPIQMDVLDMQYCDGYIVDHCSLSFGTDESAHHGWYENFTWQNNLIAENSKAMIMGQVDRGEGNFSFNSNVIYNNSHRFPNIQADGRVDLINNLVWDFHSRMSRSRGKYAVNQIGNYYSCDPYDDPANPDRRWNHIQSGTYGYPKGIYSNGNYFYDGNRVVLDGNSSNDDYSNLWFKDVSYTPLPSQYEVNTPYAQLGDSFKVLTALEVKAQLPDNCGATKRLGSDGSVISDIDDLDAIYINNIKNNVHTGWVYTGDQTSGKRNDNNSSQHYKDFQATVTGVPINTRNAGFDANKNGLPDLLEHLLPQGKKASDLHESGYSYLEYLYLHNVDN